LRKFIGIDLDKEVRVIDESGGKKLKKLNKRIMEWRNPEKPITIEAIKPAVTDEKGKKNGKRKVA